MARILIIDDEPHIRFLTRKMLENAGYTVQEAESGEAGLKILDGEKPDLILLDVMMPGIKGWEVCRRIKGDELLKGIPIIMFTIMSDSEDLERGTDCGAEAHIAKPFDREDLLDQIERLLG